MESSSSVVASFSSCSDGVPLSPAFESRTNLFTRDELIIYYSLSGFSTSVQKKFLAVHGHHLCKRQIRRIRNRLGIDNYSSESPLPNICAAIREALSGSGSLLGYRSMWNRLKITKQLNVKRDTVMMLLRILDPDASQQRASRRLKRRVYRSKGPNYIWHCDGYDKLKPFGLPIHGCIDGYSRRIMWMTCGKSNNDPHIIANHYLSTVKTIKGAPTLLKTDRGTENSIIAFIQATLRSQNSDNFAGENSFRYGRSTSNQRIEAWWAFLRTRMADWWIVFFRDLISCGHFDDSLYHHCEAIQFCFGPIVQNELNALVSEWNHHYIRKSQNSETPGGIPEVLYFIPEESGTSDHKCEVDTELVEYAQECYGINPSFCSTEFDAYARSVMNDFSISIPESVSDALELFFLLVEDMNELFLS